MLYRAFGLTFGTDTDWLPLRAAPFAAVSDVDFGFNSTPDSLAGATVRRPRIEAKPGALLYRTRFIADFLIENGRRVTIAPKGHRGLVDIANLTLGVISGIVLLQRGTPVLHGCAIDTPQGAVVMCGASGAGKSTLAMLLLQRGFRILDDNVAPLMPAEDRWMVAPGTGFVRLTTESFALLNEPPSGPSFASPAFVKHLHPLRETEWTRAARPLHSVWLLDRNATALMTPLAVAEKVAMLRAHWFAGQMAQGLGQSSLLFDTTLALANTIPMAKLGRPPELGQEAWADAVARLLPGP